VKESAKRIIPLIAACAIAFALVGCGGAYGDSAAARGVLKVFSPTDYVDRTTIAEFEKEFNIQVIYDEFESNEEMYDVVCGNPKAYDVLIPSDYTMDRLIQEGRLATINRNEVPNIACIAPEYLSPDYDAQNDYVVPYMVGTLGILYNQRFVSAPVESWAALWDSQYRGQILLWDSMRDVVGVALKMLGFSMNSNDDDELAQAKARLLAQRSLVQGYAGDIIRDIMIADEGAVALIYSGDAKTAVDQNPNLAYVIPTEGSNKWVDGFVILKDTAHLEAAQKFINFMCRPNIAIRNMTKTGYTSPVFGAWDEFYANPIMFPSAEELNRCEPFLYNRDATEKYAQIWREVR